MNHRYQNESNEAPDEEIQELMESHDLDEDTAEQVQETMDEYGEVLRRLGNE